MIFLGLDTFFHGLIIKILMEKTMYVHRFFLRKLFFFHYIGSRLISYLVVFYWLVLDWRFKDAKAS